tara:strand:- start:2194 stop:3516 length:1323 start_codon:yes stop_codon:yes gene_type:complete
MRSFKDELIDLGATVHYSSIEDKEFKEDYIEKVSKFAKKKNYTDLFFYEIEDKFFEKKINSLKADFKIVFLKSPMFLFSRKEFSNFIKDKKPFMGSFYKFSRLTNNILINNKKPEGGKWSYDEENRKKIPKNFQIPKIMSFKQTKYSSQLIPIIQKKFSSHVGSLKYIWMPTTRKASVIFLNDFIKNKFNLFGDYEDAISQKDDFLLHSALSPLLNVGLITPEELIDTITKYKNEIKINSYEGFIRQIIGWREFIRGIYQNFENTLINGNYFGNQRRMKKCWYEGTTGIPPLDDSIKKAIKIGYNHHIERLMIISNIMNLSRIDPQEVYLWFMEHYVDSSDWVMAPNVFGMGLYSDGGIFSTKPYICGSSYLLKMSDYPKGDWTDVVDGLYWKFIDEKREKLKNNPRLGIMTKMVDNMKSDRKERIFNAATNFLLRTTSK